MPDTSSPAERDHHPEEEPERRTVHGGLRFAYGERAERDEQNGPDDRGGDAVGAEARHAADRECDVREGEDDSGEQEASVVAQSAR